MSMQRRGDADGPRRAEATPASIASSTREDGQPWVDPGNPQDCFNNPSTEPAVWNNSPKNPWQCMMSPRSASGGTAANSGMVIAGGSMVNRSNMANDSIPASDRASNPNGVAILPGKPRTSGPWGRPTDMEIFEFLHRFVDIDWATIEGFEPEVHEGAVDLGNERHAWRARIMVLATPLRPAT